MPGQSGENQSGEATLNAIQVDELVGAGDRGGRGRRLPDEQPDRGQRSTRLRPCGGWLLESLRARSRRAAPVRARARQPGRGHHAHRRRPLAAGRERRHRRRSVFAVRPGGLELTDRVPRAACSRSASRLHGIWSIVLNAGGDGNIAGFSLGNDGSLTSLAGSTRPLSAAGVGPAQIGFGRGGDDAGRHREGEQHDHHTT